ncbi:MAG TPA: hypothetical protein VNK67_02165 [Burkholderiales bacterium]|nr:hypothetical protein [Burkholderiales bacterium]
MRARLRTGRSAPARLDTRHAALGLHALIVGLVSKWASNPDAVPRERDAARMVDLFLDGLARAPAGASRRGRISSNAKKR